jgi:pimeloyl-ACP methyl ester carboxylesterase
VLVVQGRQDSTILTSSATGVSTHSPAPTRLHSLFVTTLPVIEVDTLIQLFTIDFSTAQIVEQLRQRQQALTQYELFDNCGHIPMEEYPERFVDVVQQFLGTAFSEQPASISLPDSAAPQLVPIGDTTPAAAVGISRAEVVRDS